MHAKWADRPVFVPHWLISLENIIHSVHYYSSFCFSSMTALPFFMSLNIGLSQFFSIFLRLFAFLKGVYLSRSARWNNRRFFISILILGIHQPTTLFPPALFVRFDSFSIRTHGHWTLHAVQFNLNNSLVKSDYCGYALQTAAIFQMKIAPAVKTIGTYKHLVPHRTPFLSSHFVPICVHTSSWNW